MQTVAVVLCVLSVGSAVPLDFLGGLQRQPSEATGNAAGNVVTGSSGGPSQTSQIVQVSAQAGGSTSGNAVSSNSASASQGSSSGIYGSEQQANTNAVSNQQTFGGGRLQPQFQQYQPQFPQNQQYRPQNQQYRPQNQQYRPQNQQYRPQNQQYRPQNQQYQPQNQQYQPQNQQYPNRRFF